MPRLKQPTPLLNIAMDVLVAFLANHCDELSVGVGSEKLRQAVSYIKDEIRSHIPWQLSGEFYKKFFDEFENLNEIRAEERADSDRNAVLEIVMDRKILGLRCEGSIIASLDSSDVHRFQGIRLLDLSFYPDYPHTICLENFHLQDLTTFIYPEKCTDANLEVIGRNCPKLEFLDVGNSKLVTDRGIGHLHSCSELRFVFLPFCRTSYTGLTNLLSANTKIENLSAWANSWAAGFDCFSHLDSSAYTSIKNFAIVSDRVSDEHLRSVAIKFPSLTLLGISGHLAGDLRTLNSLGKLSQLDLSDASGFAWDNLKKLLTSVGANITELRTCRRSGSTSCVRESDLIFVSRNCGNIESLEFDYRPQFDGEILAVPPFPKLKYLSCRIPGEYRRRKAALEFGQMPELESLTIDRFYITADTIRSMILDNAKFPNLKVMKISEISGRRNGIDSIAQVAANNNLDFQILGI